MVGLSRERIEQILHEESTEKEDLDTILRGIYTRYMRLYEQYFADIDALNDEKIAELKAYHEETGSLIKYYYMDIPQDICIGLREFENRYSDRLLGDDWHKHLSDCYKEFREKNRNRGRGGENLKKEFAKQALKDFYDAMGYVLRDGFGTSSQTAGDIIGGISGLLFGKE